MSNEHGISAVAVQELQAPALATQETVRSDPTRHAPAPWRSLRNALGHFAIIVVGVLVALAVDEWRAERSDLAMESQYLVRLTADLGFDTASFSAFEGILRTKAQVLHAILDENGESLKEMESREAMQRLTLSGFFGLPLSRSATFRELQSTGNLALLRDVRVRDELAQYYLGYDHISRIMAASPGDYRQHLWNTIPGRLAYQWRVGDAQIDRSQLQRGLDALVSTPDLANLVNSELTYTAAMIYYLRDYKERAERILELLNAISE